MTLETMKMLDQSKISWLGWEYKTYVRKTGFNDGIFNEATGEKRDASLKLYSRPFAHAAPGLINYMNFEDQTRNFTVIWTVPAYFTSEHNAKISTGRNWHYPGGMKIRVFPEGSVVYREDGNFVYVSAATRQYPREFKLELTPFTDNP